MGRSRSRCGVESRLGRPRQGPGSGRAAPEAAATARSGADDLYAAQQRAISAIDQARAAGFDVSEDLTVTSRQTGGDALIQTIQQAHAKVHAVNIRAQAVALAALDQQVATRITTAAPSLGKVGFAEAPIYT